MVSVSRFEVILCEKIQKPHQCSADAEMKANL